MERDAIFVERLGTGVPAILVHGNGPAGPTWSAQRSLAEHHRLVIPDRRGYGRSQGESSDFAADTEDIVALLDRPTHLVGFSYGALGVLLATARRPEMVRSLALLEPAAFDVARGHPAIVELRHKLAPLYAELPTIAPEAFDARFRATIGFPPPRAWNEDVSRTVVALMHERPPWEARLPLEDIARGKPPVLIVSAGWSPAFEAVCEELTSALSAERVVYAEHGGHLVQRAPGFNDLLEDFWRRAEEREA